MSISLVPHTAHEESLEWARNAPKYLKGHTSPSTPLSTLFFAGSESLEQWQIAEKLIIACLRSGDDKSAHMCLERLVKRFGASNERVMALRGSYQEATANPAGDLEKVLAEYDDILSKSPANIHIAKRRAALLKGQSRINDAAKTLVTILEMSPTDAEAWAELSDLYVASGLYTQAAYCLEEVLLITPNAWNIHCRLGEVLYMSTMTGSDVQPSETHRMLSESIQRFCRSIELCDNYLRGYCGLQMATKRLASLIQDSGRNLASEESRTLTEVNRLNQRATSRLSAITKSNTNRPDQATITVAKAIIDKDLP